MLALLLLPLVAAKTIRPGAACGKCLDVAGVNGDAGAARISSAVTLNDCNGSSSQNWDVSSSGDTVIRLSGTTWCVDVGTSRRGPTPGWTPENGAKAKLYPCEAPPGFPTGIPAGELFQYDGAKLRIKEKALGDFCLDVENGNTGSGAQIQMWTCYAGNPNQQWGIL
ncbi:hypothetical protein CspeluHIS016_0200700 [Cutaneotrichosporon spelunceum]|uniref:Ricin B lectin domain-containing protein n=1 Tax=Cutaneotrichosporon spelunceum TaxID=1672016 RepID=A0AAD3YAS2_9TREE|nr:hypothetical protein CspeluHIS016_0200700 [Cutaneotrichosporon spelunceum]